MKKLSPADDGILAAKQESISTKQAIKYYDYLEAEKIRISKILGDRSIFWSDRLGWVTIMPGDD